MKNISCFIQILVHTPPLSQISKWISHLFITRYQQPLYTIDSLAGGSNFFTIKVINNKQLNIHKVYNYKNYNL